MLARTKLNTVEALISSALMILSKCAVWDSKKWKSIKKQEAEGLNDDFAVFARIVFLSLAI